ncbi:helix-turn-helix domain-containing protein [Kitasatospora purpeofusca]|uniref:helix-turn-helix domain-containing protein n=1 Tax=Kitasatospora purpeofusca TaxID=67352 RepID=UPI0036D3AF2D
MLLQQPEFGERLRELRLERGLSQQQLAGDGISSGYLSRLESGARPPTPKAAKYLASRLGVPLAEFRPPRADSLARTFAVACATADGERTARLLESALQAPYEPEEAVQRWQAVRLLADHYREVGERARALQALEQLLELAQECAVPELQAYSLTRIARWCRAAGQVEVAYLYATQAVALTADRDFHPADRAAALIVLVSTETAIGNLVDARVHAAELDRLAESGSPVQQATALWTTAHVHLRLGDQGGAEGRLGTALGLLRSQDDPTLWLRLRLAAASLSLQMSPRRLDRAAQCLAEASPALDLVGSVLQRQEFTLLAAQLACQQGRLSDAQALCDELTRQGDSGGSASGGGGLLLDYQEQLALKVLRSQLRVLGGDREGGIEELKKLAEEAQVNSNIDLSKEIWRTLAETVTRS